MFNRRLLIILTRKGRSHMYLSAFILIAASVICSIFVLHLTAAYNNTIRIIIDPGYGGIYSELTDNNQLPEKNFNLMLARILKEQLETMHMKTEMTCGTGNTLEPASSAMDTRIRTEMFNSGKYDIFVSLNIIRSNNEKNSGAMVLYSENNKKSSLLAKCVQNRLNSLYKKAYGVDITGTAVRSGYTLLKDANIPGILVEAGFISNWTELQKLNDLSCQAALAEQISKGIKDYLKKSKKLKEIPLQPGKETTPFSIKTDSRLVNK